MFSKKTQLISFFSGLSKNLPHAERVLSVARALTDSIDELGYDLMVDDDTTSRFFYQTLNCAIADAGLALSDDDVVRLLFRGGEVEITAFVLEDEISLTLGFEWSDLPDAVREAVVIHGQALFPGRYFNE